MPRIPKGFIPLAEGAEQLGISVQALHQRIKAGKPMRWTVRARKMYVCQADVNALCGVRGKAVLPTTK